MRIARPIATAAAARSVESDEDLDRRNLAFLYGANTLGAVTGTFIATEAPFESPSSEQYVRLATTISLFAFVVGYDPTKFQQFLNLLPRRGGKV